MPSIIGVKVQHAEDVLATRNDQPVLVRHFRHLDKRITPYSGRVRVLHTLRDVAHAERCPQTLQPVRRADAVVYHGIILRAVSIVIIVGKQKIPRLVDH